MSTALYCFDIFSINILCMIPDLSYYIISFLIMFFPAFFLMITINSFLCMKGFADLNMLIPVTLIFSNILKFFYFFFHYYSINIFGQSIFLMIFSFVLVFLKFRDEQNKNNKFLFLSTNFRKKCKCPDSSSLQRILHIVFVRSFVEFLASFLIYILILALIILFLILIAGKNPIIEAIGVFSNLIDLFTPYLIFRDIIQKENYNLFSNLFLFLYIFLDSLKIFYFFYCRVPWAFIINSIAITIIDLFYFIIILKSTTTALSDVIRTGFISIDTICGKSKTIC